MKYALVLALSLFSTLATATPMAQDKLDLINAYIATKIAENVPPGAPGSATVTVTSADVDDSTSLLTSVNVEGSSPDFKTFKIQVGLGATAGTIDISISAVGNVTEFGTDYQSAVGFTSMIQQMASQLTSQGMYVVSANISQGPDVTTGTLTVVPSPSNTASPLITGQLSGKIEASGEFSGSASASFNAQDATVQALQVAISNILNSLANQQDPASADTDVISQIISGLLTPPNPVP